MNKTAVHFGAGNIGRAFIGEILHANAYKIVFVDANEKLITELNETPSYDIEYLDEAQSHLTISNYEGLLATAEKAVLSALHEAELITISIGAANLKYLVPLFNQFLTEKASALQPREQNIICAENGVKVSSQFKALLTIPPAIAKTTSFVDAAVDRIVPTQNVFALSLSAEPFYEFALDENAWLGARLTGVDYYPNIDPLIERKLLMLNGTHAYIAWMGFGHYDYIHEYGESEVTRRIVTDYLNNLATLLAHKWKLEKSQMSQYAQKIQSRFLNSALHDDIKRVGRNIKTKLGPQERIVTPLLYAYANKLAYTAYIRALLIGLSSKNYADAEYLALREELQKTDLVSVIKSVCQITDETLLEIIREQAARLGLEFT